nr:MAG TPA: hypothetical protein [Caudoviricetes sp.]
MMPFARTMAVKFLLCGNMTTPVLQTCWGI